MNNILPDEVPKINKYNFYKTLDEVSKRILDKKAPCKNGKEN